MVRRPFRPGHAGQRGVTLVELLVAIIVVTIGVVGIMYAVAGAQRSAAINQQQAQLQSAMRQVADYVRDSSSTTGVPYTVCANAAVFTAALSGATNRPTKPAGIDWTVTQVYESTTGSRNGTSTLPIATCSSGTGDWGVQEILVEVCTPSCGSPTETLTRTVWKANA